MSDILKQLDEAEKAALVAEQRRAEMRAEGFCLDHVESCMYCKATEDALEAMRAHLHNMYDKHNIRALIDVAKAAEKAANPKALPGYKNMEPLMQGFIVGYTEHLREALGKLKVLDSEKLNRGET